MDRKVEEKPAQVFQLPKSCHVIVVVVPVPECCCFWSADIFQPGVYYNYILHEIAENFDNNACFGFNDFS